MLVNIDFMRRLRREKHLKLLDIAKIVGRDKVTVWRYENGQLEMPVSVLFCLADYYGVSVDRLRWHDPTGLKNEVGDFK